MASLTSTSGGKIPVDSTETAQRHKSAKPPGSFSLHPAPALLSPVFPHTALLKSQIFRARGEEVMFAGREHKRIQSQSNTKPQPQQLSAGT